MKITINREKTIFPKTLGNDKADQPDKFTVTFRVPNAAEMEEVLTEKTPDTKMFGKFVTKVTGLTDDLLTEIKATDIVALPGTYPLVAETAQEILRAGMLTVDEKNA
jgi:N-acetyl-gamma-glutamylphosphate reductase